MNSMFNRVRMGQTLDDTLIIDSHCHMGFYYQFNAPNNTAEGMLESMDAIGINMAFVAAHASIGPDYIYGNNMIIDAVTKYPDRFIGYITLNPHYPKDMLNEIERCLKVPGMRGIKLHPECHQVPIDYKNYHIAYEFANEMRFPVLIHTWGIGDIRIIGKLAEKYPEIRFIAGHSGGDVRAMEETVNVVNSNVNVYADLTVSMVREGNVEWFVSQVGSRKLLYGSDMPFFDPRAAFGRVALARLSDDEKKDILGLNIKRILENR